MNAISPPLLLGSTSPFRKMLLEKLGIAFETASPDIDETRQDNEQPNALVERLAHEKAKAISLTHQQHLIIGSDQVCCIDGIILGKPGNRENAIKQLQHCSGKTVTFYTGLCLLNSSNGKKQVIHETYDVTFRTLSSQQIEDYVDAEKPYNCAGSFKSEALGVVLFDSMTGRDPNSLIGLPLMALTDMLKQEGIQLPLSAQ